MPTDERPQLDALTGLRYVAAMQVLLYHVYFPASAAAPGWVRALLGSGYVGVSLFFVLSGFVLAYNYLEPLAGGRVSRREFWTARIARVYPVYLLGLLAGLPVFVLWMLRVNPAPVALRWVAGVSAACVALVQAWAPQTACALNCPGWSLSAEAFFYLAFPFLVVPVRRASTRGLLVACALAWIAALAVPAAYMAMRPERFHTITWSTNGAWVLGLKLNPLLRFPEFLMGVAAGRLFLEGRFQRIRWGSVEVAAATAVVAALLATPTVPYLLVHNGLLAPLFAALVVVLALGVGPLSRLLSRPAMLRLGGASYALYILHMPLSDWSAAAVKALGTRVTWPSLFAVGFAAVATGVALAVFRWVEEPARRALRRRLEPRVEPPAGDVVRPARGLVAEAGD
jgi:peptidoglycan/LPS O-acetylase OafA/YrhL